MANKMKKIVLDVDGHNRKERTKAMLMVARIAGVQSVALDAEENELTVTGDVDLEEIACRQGKKAKVAPPLYHYGRYVTPDFGQFAQIFSFEEIFSVR